MLRRTRNFHRRVSLAIQNRVVARRIEPVVMAPPKAKERAQDRDLLDGRDPEASDATLNLRISAGESAVRNGIKTARSSPHVGSLTVVEPAGGMGTRTRPDRDGDNERDPESGDAALTDQIAGSEGADPATTELQESAVAPVGLAPVDLVATPPSTGAAPAPGGPLPGRWVLTDAEIRPIILGVCLSMFVSAFNQTVIATALPTIGRDFNDFENLSWLITAYLLTSTVAAPLFGKLSDIYGRRKVMLSALGLFMLGSVACALAPNMLLLILCRGLQGLGGGGLVPLVQATVADAVAPRERGRYQAYIGTVWIAAGTAGPVAGGYVADHLHWSVVFWLNIPLGLAAAFMTYRNLARLPRHDRKHKLDLVGAVLMMLAAIMMLLVLTWGGARFAWTSPQIMGLLAASGLLWLAFTFRLTHTAEPFLPLAVLANPVVRAGTLAASFAVGSQIGLTIYMPLFYESVHHLSASSAGWALIPIAVMTTPGSILSGQVMVRFNRYKWLPMIGLSVAALTHMLLAVWPTAPLWAVIAALCVIGTGVGTVFSVATVSIQNAVSRFQVGIATGVMNFFRALFSALVVAIMGAIVLAFIGGEGRAVDALASAGAGGVDLAGAFRWVFVCGAVFLLLALIALTVMEERPLRGRSELPAR
jgi:EmrB/QacA subfamily drug resistance transporter